MAFWSGLSLMHPWALGLGAAAVALPVAIHLLTRPRPVRLPLSTLRFVREAIQQKHAHHRLRDILVLLLRALAVLLLAWAFARPLVGAKPMIDPAAPGSIVRVVVLDNSLSMSAVSNNSGAFDRARASAAQYLQYQPGLRADVIVAAAQPQAMFANVSANVSAMRDSLASLSPQPQRLDAQAAINLAAAQMSSAPQAAGARLELIVISDFQRTSWASADFSPIPKDASIQFETVAPKDRPDNLAILRIGARGRMEQGRAVRLEAEIGNYSNTPRQVQCDVNLGSQTYPLQGLCPAGVKTTLSSMITLPAKAGWLTGAAKLTGVTDALAVDNERPIAIHVRPLPVYALITREPSKPHASSSHFLERALVPSRPRSGETSETVVRLDPDHLDHDVIQSAGLLVLDHPGILSDDSIHLLAALVRRGRGLLYIAAEPPDAENLRRFAKASESDLKMPVELTAPDPSQPRKDLFLLDWKRDQSPFDQLGDTLTAVAGSLRFSRGLSSHRIEGGLSDDVLATYSDRSACLVVTPCGAGTLAVLNADLTESNLPSSPLFVPMVEELCGRLLAVSDSTDAAPCGEPLSTYLPADGGPAKGLKIIAPTGATEDLGTISDESTGVLWHADAAGSTGIYQVKRGDSTVYALATAAPASESDLDSIDASTLTNRIAQGRRAIVHSSGDLPVKDQAWAWLLVFCSLCLVGEIAVLKLFRT